MKTKTLFFMALALLFAACSSPESDGKKAAENFCDCEKQFAENQDKAAEKFIAAFDGSNFRTRVAAREKLNELQNKAVEEHEKCVQKAQEAYAKLAGKYIGNYEKTTKFQYAYNALMQRNRNENVAINPQLEQQINSSILSIIPPKPDLEKLKNDLIAKLDRYEECNNELKKSIDEIKKIDKNFKVNTDYDKKIKIEGILHKISEYYKSCSFDYPYLINVTKEIWQQKLDDADISELSKKL